MARSTYEDFVVKEKIGSGSYGLVTKVIRKVDRHTYAMKEEQEECIRETRVLSSLDSDYIIKYYDSFLERGKLYIITEYAGNGNLHDYIKKQKAKLPEDLIWKLFIQILLGLNHMHEKKILHRDIKTLNVFLDDDLNVKLGDMGVAKILSTNTNFAKTIVGTPYYLSPELCEDKPYNEKSDVWALGVVLYECCTQRHPFDADNQGALILKILRGKYPAVNHYSAEINDIIKRCLTQNANRRPNTYKVLTLPIIRQKAEEQGITMPDQQVTALKAEMAAAPKLKPAAPAAAPADEPPAASQPAPSSSGIGDKPAALASTLLARLPNTGAPGQSDPAAVQVQALEPNWQAPPKTGVAGWAQAAKQMEGLGVNDEEEPDEEDGAQDVYRKAYLDEADGEEEEGEAEAGDAGDGEEGGEDDDGYDEAGAGYEDEPAWQPDPTRFQNMQAAALLQRTACLDLIGDKAFNELYALLKSNQVDEASMTDLSRLVFKIIPYDKSEVIQMMYKLLYLESQLEGNQ